MSYTKGPWKLQLSEYNQNHPEFYDITDMKGNVLISDGHCGSCGIVWENPADAVLCSAAPELYEFAKIMQEVLKEETEFNSLAEKYLVMCNHAINKAEGK